MRRLLLAFYEWVDRLALRLNEATLRLSRWALKRRARACGCAWCCGRTSTVDAAAAVRELLARWSGEAPAVAREGRPN